MSLTGQLSHGALGRWCADTFTGTPSVVGRVVTVARAGGTPPVRPVGQVTGEHWADVGGAFGQRLADLVDPAPPYGALLGMIRAGWLTWGQAHEQAAAYPSHVELPAWGRARALSLRRTPDGWMDLGPTRDRDDVDPAAGAVLVDLLDRTRAYQAAHAPAGTLGNRGVEAGLARSAWVLAACEGIHRSGQVDERLAEVLHGGGGAADLRAIPTEAVVTELVDLAERVHTGGVLARLRRGAGDPEPGSALGVAAPTLVPGWADGDLLIGTAEQTTLVDVKTVISLDPARISRWLWQILAYAWLDTGDLHNIRNVGLYLARHGVLVTWGLPTFVAGLLGDTSPGMRERTRRAFLALATEVICIEGGRFPIA